jgi:hypothetical protein
MSSVTSDAGRSRERELRAVNPIQALPPPPCTPSTLLRCISVCTECIRDSSSQQLFKLRNYYLHLQFLVYVLILTIRIFATFVKLLISYVTWIQICDN